jgi:ribonuclease I
MLRVPSIIGIPTGPSKRGGRMSSTSTSASILTNAQQRKHGWTSHGLFRELRRILHVQSQVRFLLGCKSSQALVRPEAKQVTHKPSIPSCHCVKSAWNMSGTCTEMDARQCVSENVATDVHCAEIPCDTQGACR